MWLVTVYHNGWNECKCIVVDGAVKSPGPVVQILEYFNYRINRNKCFVFVLLQGDKLDAGRKITCINQVFTQ